MIFGVALFAAVVLVAIKLIPLGTVSGHVLDEDGDPIPRAQIAVERLSLIHI